VGEIHYCLGGSNLGWVISAKRPSVWLHLFIQQTSIEIVERSGITAGPDSRTFEEVFQITIVVAVEATNLYRFLATL
jgi:hypothetical protein